MKRTLEVWPVRSAIFTIDGYFQRLSWFSVNPWELSNSRSCLFQRRAQTWEPVSTVFKQEPTWVFHNLMHRSSPPPPEASKFPWNGHQARAFTAAVWSSSLWSHWFAELAEAMELSHMKRRLSFPPLANCLPEGDHLSPQTSCWCPLYVSTMCSLTLTSLLMILPSIPPVVSMWLFQASELTRNLWPPLNVLSCKRKRKEIQWKSMKQITKKTYQQIKTKIYQFKSNKNK